MAATISPHENMSSIKSPTKAQGFSDTCRNSLSSVTYMLVPSEVLFPTPEYSLSSNYGQCTGSCKKDVNVVLSVGAVTYPDTLRDALLAWYAVACRDLPWRHTRDPYAIWVSEVMLQQTRVATVIPYYRRFLARFPTIEHLAHAPLDDVLALWQGLGYYRRARNLHRAAALVCERHHGCLPADGAALMELPGIGAYTAGAILSIAFGKPVTALDANAVRVLVRLLDLDESPLRASAKHQLEAAARSLLPADDPGRLNQALMELGALVCTATNPHCHLCPWCLACLALLHDTVSKRPVRRVRRQVPTKSFVGACILDGTSILLCHREPRGLLGGLWEIPSVELAHEDGVEDALRNLVAHLGLYEVHLDASGSVRHAYSHFGVRLYLYTGAGAGEGEATSPWDRCAWVPLGDLDRYGLTGVTLKALDLAQEQGALPR